jgi:hypothetical protein
LGGQLLIKQSSKFLSLSPTMALMAIAIVAMSFLSYEVGIVLGDIGTATSYNPPYLRE